MARPSSEFLTRRESEIMSVLWERGSLTAEEIRRALPGALHDSTVRTLLRVLEGKGYVKHTARGKSYIYSPVVARARAERGAVRSLLRRFFGGSVEALVLRLIEDEELTPEQVEELRKASRPALAKKQRNRRKKG